MRKLFDSLFSGGEVAIHSLRGTQETVDLEFKTKEDPKSGVPSTRDRQNLGKELSALSNSMGGLLVWGVFADDDPQTKVDCVQSFHPIADISRFKAEITRAISQVIMPRHTGILVEAIPTTADPTAGYLLVYVERSERRPHRSEAKDDKTYYKRVGDSAIAMEHYDIEDSFKRFSTADLELSWSLAAAGSHGGPDGKFASIGLWLRLTNQSTITARFPYLLVKSVEMTTAPLKVSVTPTNGWEKAAANLPIHVEAKPDVVIHPDITREVALVQFSVPFEVTSPLPGGSIRRAVKRTALSDMRITYRLGCLDARAKDGEIELRADQLLGAIPEGFWC